MTEVIVWSGWLGGLAIGLYALSQFLLTGKLLGVSTAYGNVCSFISKAPFFHRGAYEQPNNWRLWFILGIPLGGFIAALSSPGSIFLSLSLGTLYDTVFPQAVWAKALLLIAGGMMIGFGARMAGGCTSGHSIAGMSLLNPPSILASIGFFIGGIAVVQVLFSVFA